jgi:hypothetical protein
MLDKAIRLMPILAIMFFSVLMLQLTLPYFSFRTDVDFLLTKQGIIHIKIWRWAFYTHISTSLVVLVSGAFQFVRPLMLHKRQLHRNLGKLYVVLVLFFSGPSGLIMGYYGNGGVPAEISFMIQAMLWIIFTYLAYYYIRKKNLRLHTRFMIMSYALTLAAITLRSYAFLLPHFTNLQGKEAYIFLAWSSWVPNLIVAEILIRKGFMRRLKSA